MPCSSAAANIMSDDDDGLLSIDVSIDHYAETAAGDTPGVPRGYQSEADFQAQKAGYTAKIDDGNTFRDLDHALTVATEAARLANASKAKLSKKDLQLLGYAAAELYYDKEYGPLLELCERVKKDFEIDNKTLDTMNRWTSRCKQRLEKEHDNNDVDVSADAGPTG